VGENTTFIGLDVHKETITVALAESGERGEVREYGRIANSPEALKGLLRNCSGRAASCSFATKPVRVATASNAN
jgi:transposase